MLPGLKLADTHQNTAEQVRSFKSGNRHRHPVAFGKTPVIPLPRHGAHMAGSQKAVRPSFLLVHQPFQGGRNLHMGAKHGKIGMSQGTRLLHGQRRGRSGSLKTHGKKHHVQTGIVSRQRNGLQRRIH